MNWRIAMIYFDMNIYNRMFDDQRQTRIRLETEAISMLHQDIIQNMQDCH